MKKWHVIVALGLLLGIAPAKAQSPVYDAGGRLIESRLSNTQRVSYAYDSWGNITQSVSVGIQGEVDSDSDSLPDAWEWVFFNTLTNAAGGDPNQNGKNNLWEYQNGYDPLDPDSDGDGAPNTDETAAGTDPLNPDSVFEMSAFRVQVSGNVVQWQSATGKIYQLLRLSNLITGQWALVTGATASPPLNVHTDATAVGAGPWLYRIELE